MTVKVLLFSDFAAPYCCIAERGSVARLRREEDIEVEWHGYELHPGTPEGGVPLTMLIPAEGIPLMRFQVLAYAARFGVTDLTIGDRIPNTRRALAMAEYARAHGQVDAFRRAAMDARWVRDEDLESEEVLKGLAAQVGLEPEEAWAATRDPLYLGQVDAARARGEQLGVNGLPTFFIGGRRVVGCPPVEVLRAEIRRAASE